MEQQKLLIITCLFGTDQTIVVSLVQLCSDERDLNSPRILERGIGSLLDYPVAAPVILTVMYGECIIVPSDCYDTSSTDLCCYHFLHYSINIQCTEINCFPNPEMNAK